VLGVPHQAVQAVGCQSLLLARLVEFAPAPDEQADTNEQQPVTEQHRDQHARLAQAEQRGPEVGIEIGPVQPEKSRQQVNAERETIHLRIQCNEKGLYDPGARPFTPGLRGKITIQHPRHCHDHDRSNAPGTRVGDGLTHTEIPCLRSVSRRPRNRAPHGIATCLRLLKTVLPMLANIFLRFCLESFPAGTGTEVIRLVLIDEFVGSGQTTDFHPANRILEASFVTFLFHDDFLTV
jgi:hypothetical protein